MQRQNLGLLGETAFKSLCLAAGLTINSSNMDMTGWDFFIEFPFNQHNYLPQDLFPTPIECKIQVKSTDGRKRKNDIALSNLNRLITTQLPTFFCFIEFDGKDLPQAIYLVHVGREIIERTLKKIRELEAKGCGNKLNKNKLSITYKDTDRLEIMDGMGLKVAIEKYIPNGMKKYIESKNQILNTIGFEDGKYQAKITVEGSNPLEDFVDMTLGLRKEINISSLLSYHKRFEILSIVPNLDFGEGTISIDSIPSEVTLKFKENKFSSGIRFAAKLYIPPFSQELLKKHGKLRVVSRFFELIFELDKVKKFSILPYLDKEAPLGELVKFLNLLSIFEKTSKTITLEIESQIPGLSPLFGFRSNNILSSLFNMNEVDHQKSTWNVIAKRVEIIAEICKKMNISEENLLVKVNDLLSIYQDDDFQLLCQVLCGRVDSITIDFPDGVEGYQENAKTLSIRFVKFSIGNYAIGCCLGISGDLTLVNGQQKMICQEFIVGRKFIETDDISQEQIEMSLDELVEDLQNEYFLITVMSY